MDSLLQKKKIVSYEYSLYGVVDFEGKNIEHLSLYDMPDLSVLKNKKESKIGNLLRKAESLSLGDSVEGSITVLPIRTHIRVYGTLVRGPHPEQIVHVEETYFKNGEKSISICQYGSYTTQRMRKQEKKGEGKKPKFEPLLRSKLEGSVSKEIDAFLLASGFRLQYSCVREGLKYVLFNRTLLLITTQRKELGGNFIRTESTANNCYFVELRASIVGSTHSGMESSIIESLKQASQVLQPVVNLVDRTAYDIYK